jgi:hypothetical protein
MFNRPVTDERLSKLERLISRLENRQCCACAIVTWSYTGTNAGDTTQFTITVNNIEVVSVDGDSIPHTGAFTVKEGDIVELTIGNNGGFHIFGYSISGSVSGPIDSSGGSTGFLTSAFTVTCQTYTITGNQ